MDGMIYIGEWEWWKQERQWFDNFNRTFKPLSTDMPNIKLLNYFFWPCEMKQTIYLTCKIIRV